jgi:hypothetical protein
VRCEIKGEEKKIIFFGLKKHYREFGVLLVRLFKNPITRELYSRSATFQGCHLIYQ